MNRNVEIIDNTKEAEDNYGHLWGSSTAVITQEHIDALLNGKQIAFNDGEYSQFITMNIRD
ncbi:MAG TPA: hypothetical protein GXZ90_06300 [Clostridiales bacterium]|nr:hypothetical protein [Clostridiales bacterium]